MLLRLLKEILFLGKRVGRSHASVAAGIKAYEVRDYNLASAHLASAVRVDPACAVAHFYLGLIATVRESHDDALVHFENACLFDPANQDYQDRLRVAQRRTGNTDEYYRQMASRILPGSNYYDCLRQIHRHLRPRTYLEIGVETGMSINLALSETRAVGVDPAPKLQFGLTANTVIHTLSSDDFFATCDVRSEFGGQPIDLAFIDGMHRFEFALRDFINVEKHCSTESTVLVHDCYPLDRETAGRVPPRTRAFWSGDIWRLVLALKKYRPDLRIHTLAAAPTGLGMVRGLDPGSRTLEQRYAKIVSEYLALDYSVLDADKVGLLSLVPSDLQSIKAILAS